MAAKVKGQIAQIRGTWFRKLATSISSLPTTHPYCRAQRDWQVNRLGPGRQYLRMTDPQWPESYFVSFFYANIERIVLPSIDE